MLRGGNNEVFDKQIEALRQSRKRTLVINMLTVFGDESHDERKQRVFAVAGVIGTQEEWDRLDPIWTKRTKGIPFHAADCETGKGEFKKNTHKKNLKLYADLTNILATSNFIGYGLAIDIDAYRRFIPQATKGMPYLMCFSRVVLWLTNWASKQTPKQKAKFIFDQNLENEYNAGLLYSSMRRYPEVTFSDYFDEISFASREKVGIQCADLLAREIMKHADNRYIQISIRPVRKSMQALFNTERFHFEYFGWAYYAQLALRIGRLNSVNGIGLTDYGRWLAKYRRKDNTTNRIQYTTYVRSKP